jgi:sec-independent protein translocase protein TatB
MEIPVFDLSLPKLLILAVLALVVFGPNELPKIAAQAGRAVRDLRRIADGAKADLREGLGPEFSDFDLDDLHPRRFVQKHLLSDLSRDDPDEADVSGKTPATAFLAGEKDPSSVMTERPFFSGPAQGRGGS